MDASLYANPALLGYALFAAVVLPAALTLTFPIAPLAGVTVRLVPWAAVPALALSLLATQDVAFELPWLFLGTHIGLDLTARVFLFFTAWLWIAAGWYARNFVTGHRRVGFAGFFLLAMSGNLGVIVARDLASFLLFFALMSFASYGLIVHRRTPAALRAGRIYITLVAIGEAALLAAALLAWHQTGTIELDAMTRGLAFAPRRDLVLALFFVGFGVKAGALGLHVWKPPAYFVAPAPGSAVLSGAMLKAGLLGWMRFFPAGEVALVGWARVLVAGGLVAVFYAAAVGLMQPRPKVILAYSSISQMGFMTVLFGLGLGTPEVWPLALVALLVYAVHHGLVKGALFLGTNVARHRIASRPARGLVAAGLVFAALALAGAPLTSGAIAKTALKDAAYHSPLHGAWMTFVLSLGAVGTTLLMVRYLWAAWPEAPEEQGGAASDPEPYPWLTAGLWIPWALVVLSVLLVPRVLGFLDLSEAGAASLLRASVQWSSIWPLLTGLALAAATIVAMRRSPAVAAALTRLRVPPGDIVVAVTWLLGHLVRLVLAARSALRRAWQAGTERLYALIRAHEHHSAVLSDFERRLVSWDIGVMWLVVLLVALLVAVALGYLAP